MSLPPGFLDELRTRVSLSQVVGRKVTWDARKSNQGRGDMWAPCPFHQEKSPSFHVDDRKGFYYCFGCHAKGDALSFVQETENVGFMEAVEILAGEAGMQMPARDPQAQQKADRRTRLLEVMDQAVAFYRLQLKTGPAAEARAYLAGRGLDDAACARWEVGFAPAGWQALRDALSAKGVDDAMLVDLGLAKTSRTAGDKPPYDTFRNRILFPIQDSRGRPIGFGGRAMDPEDKAKYLNSPETPLFDKGRSLFNFARAREAAGKGRPLIVAEGYMDVIALAEHGFGATVAPLGTAITADQLALMWRIADEPVIALDGDRAGLAAAMRVIDTALPLLEAGKSLRFCLMPEGKDPDDLLREQGAGAMDKALAHARPMVDLLWQRETEGGTYDSPERRAALDKSLRTAIGKIRDPFIRAHYGEAIKQKRWTLFNPGRGAGGRTWTPKGARLPAAAATTTRASLLAQGDAALAERLREQVILAILISEPAILPQFEDALERLEFSDPDHARIADALIRHMEAEDPRAALEDEVGTAPLEKLFAPRHVTLCPAVRAPGDPEIAALCVAEELSKLHARRGARHEIEEAVRHAEADANEGMTWRLGQAVEARNRAERAETEDRTEFELGANGARINRGERLALDSLLERISRGKTK